MGYRLRDEVTYCRHNDVMVVLDLENDRYRALHGAAARALDALSDQSGSRAAEADGLEALVQKGILVFGPEWTDVRPCEHEPARTALGGGGRAGPVEFCSILATILQVRARLRREGVHRLLSRLASTGDPAKTGNRRRTRPLTLLAARFSVVEAFVERSGNCLSRSIALAVYLRRNGYRANIVFAVALNPFRAHCWVEHGEFTLNDDPDHIRCFTPIRVLTL